VQYEFKRSFDRAFKKLPTDRRESAYAAIDVFMNYLDGSSPLPAGLGLKNWRGDYWEIRSSLRDRILFKFTDRIIFLFIGNHDAIRSFMKRR
jgi:hypothetical protein